MERFAFLFLIIGILITGCQSTDDSKNPDVSLTPVSSFSHAHGLAVDPFDENKLYIATHEGLFVLIDGKNLYRVGKKQDDYMGFSAHPSVMNTFYTSGHPRTGGNIGIQRSQDGGVTWQKLSDGISGPVDFHSMTISPADPNLLYGWYGALQRSQDGGKNWELVPSDLKQVISLTAHPKEKDTIFATTAKGIQVSKDQGKTWGTLSEQLGSAAVIALAVSPSDSNHMLSSSDPLGFQKSIDGGKSWQKIEQDAGVILFIAYNPKNPNRVYALNTEGVIYSSTDAGEHWSMFFGQ
ncbi:MAG: hypothetical protein Q8P95_04925 [bacterium]|nr:hypothetical protein [bacterium]